MAQSKPLVKKLEHFWASLFLTPEGKPKSAMLLYSFCLCMLYLVIYGAAYWFLIDEINKLGGGDAVQNILQCVLPGLAGSIPCCALYFAFRDKWLVPTAYIWMTALAVAMSVAMIFLTDKEGYAIYASVFGKLIAVPLLVGCSFTHSLHRRYRKREEARKAALQADA